MPQNHLFEIPQELRRLAEDNVDRARRLYLQFLDGVSKAMAVWPAPSSDVIMPGFQEVRERAVKFAKENAEAAFALAGDIAKGQRYPRIARSSDPLRTISDEVVCGPDTRVWTLSEQSNGRGKSTKRASE